MLACYAVAAWLILRDAPGRVVPTTSLASRLSANARLSITWQACSALRGRVRRYVAFSVYLPAYLKTAHGLTPADAANRMAGFVVVAVIMRPVGGWLADRTRRAVLPPGSGSWSSVPRSRPGRLRCTDRDGRFLAMAAALGSGSGRTFALIAQVTEPSRVGGVTGLVGAAGGLGASSRR